MTSNKFRYLVLNDIFNDLTDLAKKGHKNDDEIISGWIIADRRGNFGIIRKFILEEDNHNFHERPKSWIRLKRRKIWMMRKLKKDLGCDIVWHFHIHPDGSEELKDIDLDILNYLGTGVMIVVTPSELTGWYFNKWGQKKPTLEKMRFEVILEEMQP